MLMSGRSQYFHRMNLPCWPDPPVSIPNLPTAEDVPIFISPLLLNGFGINSRLRGIVDLDISTGVIAECPFESTPYFLAPIGQRPDRHARFVYKCGRIIDDCHARPVDADVAAGVIQKGSLVISFHNPLLKPRFQWRWCPNCRNSCPHAAGRSKACRRTDNAVDG